MTPTDELFDTLNQFGKNQLQGVNARSIPQVTAHLMVATAFFTGAVIQLASRQRLPKSVYLPALQHFLSQNFGLPERNAVGLIESNARLYKRYTLIENIYNQGRQAGKKWQEENSTSASVLAPLLHRYRDLSMSTLGMEGMKERPVSTPEVEEIVAVEPVPPAVPKRASRRWLWWLLLLVAAAAGVYHYFKSAFDFVF